MNSDRFRQWPALVLGNGPSARVVDFERLQMSALASVGMNAAYRHWDRIGFRPHYYICLDDTVVKSHGESIQALVREQRIRAFFLHDELRVACPHLGRHPEILWYSESRKLGPLFEGALVTTGSWAIRWMAWLGHPIVLTIGLDGDYVEILPEARTTGGGQWGLGLEMVETPSYNPNYFFPDYQQAGDLYNIPNDTGVVLAGGGLLHSEAVKSAGADLRRAGLRAMVLDAGCVSRQALFPTTDLDAWTQFGRIALVLDATGGCDEWTPDVARCLAENLQSGCLGEVHVLLPADADAELRGWPVEVVSAALSAREQGRLVLVGNAGSWSLCGLMDYCNRQVNGTVALGRVSSSASLSLLAGEIWRHRHALHTGSVLRFSLDHAAAGSIGSVRADASRSSFRPTTLGAFAVFQTPMAARAGLQSLCLADVDAARLLPVLLEAAGGKVTCERSEGPRPPAAAGHDFVRSEARGRLLSTFRACLDSFASRRGGLSRSIDGLSEMSGPEMGFGPGKTTAIEGLFTVLSRKQEAGDEGSVAFRRMSISAGAGAESIATLLPLLSGGGVFVEWEFTGFGRPLDVEGVLREINVPAEQTASLAAWPYQSHIHLDLCPVAARAAFAELLIVLKELWHVAGVRISPTSSSGQGGRPESRVLVEAEVVPAGDGLLKQLHGAHEEIERRHDEIRLLRAQLLASRGGAVPLVSVGSITIGHAHERPPHRHLNFSLRDVQTPWERWRAVSSRVVEHHGHAGMLFLASQDGEPPPLRGWVAHGQENGRDYMLIVPWDDFGRDFLNSSATRDFVFLREVIQILISSLPVDQSDADVGNLAGWRAVATRFAACLEEAAAVIHFEARAVREASPESGPSVDFRGAWFSGRFLPELRISLPCAPHEQVVLSGPKESAQHFLGWPRDKDGCHELHWSIPSTLCRRLVPPASDLCPWDRLLLQACLACADGVQATEPDEETLPASGLSSPTAAVSPTTLWRRLFTRGKP